MKVLSDATDRSNSLALAKILAVMALKLRGAKVLELKNSIVDPNYKKALNFLSNYSDDTQPFSDYYRMMLKKSDAVLPYAQPLGVYLRKTINSSGLKSNLDSLSTTTKESLAALIAMFNDPSKDSAFDRTVKTVSGLGERTLTAAYVALYSELSGLRAPNIEEPPPKPENSSKPVVIKPSIPKSAKPASDIGNAQTIVNIDKQIRSIGKQVTGRDDVTQIPVADQKEYRKDPQKAELLKQFNKLRKQLSDVKINEVRAVVTQSGKDQLPLRDIVKGLKARGITKLTIPAGLQSSTIVYMNADAQYCDSQGRIAVRQGANFPGATFTHNDSYEHGAKKNNWLFKINTPAGVNYVQTEDRVSENRAARFEKVDQALDKGIDQVKASWRESMMGDLNSERTVYANVAEFLFQTASRVGAREGMTDNERTYGATNFLVKHIENLPKTKNSVPSRLTISYPIKSGAKDTFVLTSSIKELPSQNDVQYMKRLIEFVCKKAQGKKPDDIVFTINNKRINTDKLNAFLNETLGSTAKGFRTLRGTQLCIYALSEAKKEYDRLAKQAKNKTVPASTVNALFDAAMESVGELLGHVRNTDDGEKVTGATALKSYCNPRPLLDFYRECNTSPPKKVTTAARLAGIEV